MAKPFHTIATPHKDILEGRFTLDVYAANLWKVFHKTGPAEYHNAAEFFNRTHLTYELGNLLTAVEQRIKGLGGDPVIQLQTPFGGGKTHTLIAFYHKASEWEAKPVVIVGEEMNAGSSVSDFDTPWGLIEKQLTGSIDEFKGHIPPGGEQIRNMLEKHAPVIILMDEMIPYLNKCDVTLVEGKHFSTLVLDFIQILTNVVSSTSKVCFVLTTTPSNPNDKTQRGTEIVSQLQNAAGRVDMIKSPVKDEEISSIIRKRLFSHIDESQAKSVVSEFVEYAVKNSIIPVETEKTEYHKRFLDSYPFLPEVIDVLYHRWGSFPNFQRTRGVLRLLALVVNALKEKNLPYISLADFALKEDEIRLELLKHIGSQYESIVSQDIIGKDCGAARVDNKVGDSYKGLKVGTRTATTIFMYSFSGSHEDGVTLGEAKRVATTMDCPATLISDVFEDLKNTLYFLKNVNNKYLFTTEPNLNQILNIRMENVLPPKVAELQESIFRKYITNNKLKTYYLPKNPSDIPDSQDFKLVILPERSESVMREFLEKKGATPRTNRNTVFFLVPYSSEKIRFENNLRKLIAYKQILGDATLNLSVQQQTEVRKEIQKIEEHHKDDLRSYYRTVYLPDKNFVFKELELGIPTVGDKQNIDDEVYSRLRSNSDIMERIVPIVIREKFLKGKEYVQIEPIYISSLTTPGESRYTSEDIINECIVLGVQQGVFGLGILQEGNPVCKYFQEKIASVSYGVEIIIDADICKSQRSGPSGETGSSTSSENPSVPDQIPSGPTEPTKSEEPIPEKANKFSQISLDFDIPVGKTSSMLGMINLLQKYFKNVHIEIKATDGELDKQDYEDKIRETLRQMGVE